MSNGLVIDEDSPRASALPIPDLGVSDGKNSPFIGVADDVSGTEFPLLPSSEENGTGWVLLAVNLIVVSVTKNLLVATGCRDDLVPPVIHKCRPGITGEEELL
ncbi:MAG: hypothetical protein AB7V39_02995 [Nitrospiraceae bacterium]